ncbi:MAG: hypothetical protein LIV29_08030 [Denitrobacterium sp.]|nr:hypothetical protein [Denitrobacterium sp.]
MAESHANRSDDHRRARGCGVGAGRSGRGGQGPGVGGEVEGAGTGGRRREQAHAERAVDGGRVACDQMAGAAGVVAELAGEALLGLARLRLVAL